MAYALDLLVRSPRPVVVTGAMRNPTVAGADGPANLLAAVQTAASAAAVGLGCLVVLNDEIHAARLVVKGHTARPDAFVSPLGGPLGYVAEGLPRVLLRPVSAPVALPGRRRAAAGGVWSPRCWATTAARCGSRRSAARAS